MRDTSDLLATQIARAKHKAAILNKIKIIILFGSKNKLARLIDCGEKKISSILITRNMVVNTFIVAVPL